MRDIPGVWVLHLPGWARILISWRFVVGACNAMGRAVLCGAKSD